MKKFVWMLLILFVCGVLSGDICVKALQEQNIVMTLANFQEYAYGKIPFQNAVWGVLYERGKLFCLLFLILLTPLKKRIWIVFSSIFSFVWGFFIMSCIVTLGFVGVVAGLCSVLPHGVFYLASFLMMHHNRNARRYIKGEKLGRNVLQMVFALLLFITGCILETVIGTQFLPWVIRLSLV